VHDIETIYQLLEEMKMRVDMLFKRMPFIYTQVRDDDDGIFTVEVPTSKQFSDNILYFVPVKYSIATPNDEENKLRLKKSLDEEPIEFTIVIEHSDGTLKKAGLGAIVPNRLCMIRFSGNHAIIINPSLTTDLSASNLVVTDNVTFYERPVVYLDDITDRAEVVVDRDLDRINLELNKISDISKILIGTDTAENALQDAENGTIYLRREE